LPACCQAVPPSIAVGGDLSQAALTTMLAQGDAKAALAQAIAEDAVVTTPLPGDKELRLALVPAMQDRKLARIYAFTVDQAAAASLTNIALTVVTLTTSLLIVMGFSVPAAIASRRIRERWLAEDQAISPCTTISPACPTGFSSISTLSAPWPGPSAMGI
jgi:hypothetical protein